MKKTNLYLGILLLFIGFVCLSAASGLKSGAEGLLPGLAGVGIGGGIIVLFRFLYWSNPKNQDKYKEKTGKENQDFFDQRKAALWDKAAKYAYVTGAVVIAVSIVIFSIWESLDKTANFLPLITYLTGFMLFQIVIGILIFSYLNKKY